MKPGLVVAASLLALATAAPAAGQSRDGGSVFGSSATAIDDSRLSNARAMGAEPDIPTAVISGNRVTYNGPTQVDAQATISESFNGSRGIVTTVQNLGDHVSLHAVTNVTVNIY